ncbi:ATP-binding cassette domain-containing protein [Hymenobacter sp. HMF4947]|uniref:ATP-binding cassette domain-containing protein n=1 Tax=Hymenobacter ginkgonis TaxID=2682976 RepID=A0A7K1TEF0_9BACT|nr:ATP-binding cassette domain-containing protein [Hymenobacter ginkgonis]MVN76776.1 ATP-binding cassette domain-containing protein [Hymenobacter ginkgonis]
MIDLHLIKALHTAAGPRTLDVRLTLPPGEVLALSGPSGAGKTTLLRLLAGLSRPDGGFLQVEGQVWYSHERGQWLPPQRRPLGFVFQDYALFPNMTVRENLAFAAEGQPQARQIIDGLLELLELTELAPRRPAALSGGQQQRVALARALARRPRLLLLDEPLSALDLATRLRLQQALADIHREFKLTTVLISHDPAEIARLATRVVELDLGQVVRVGPPVPVAALGTTVGGRVVAVLPGGHLRVQLGGSATLVEVPAPTGPPYAPGDELALSLAVVPARRD